MSYDQQILKILTEAGERGISVQNISRHVYNLNCTFFNQPDYEEVRNYVQQYLLKNSRDDIVNDDVQPSTQQDLSLDLFDGVI